MPVDAWFESHILLAWYLSGYWKSGQLVLVAFLCNNAENLLLKSDTVWYTLVPWPLPHLQLPLSIPYYVRWTLPSLTISTNTKPIYKKLLATDGKFPATSLKMSTRCSFSVLIHLWNSQKIDFGDWPPHNHTTTRLSSTLTSAHRKRKVSRSSWYDCSWERFIALSNEILEVRRVSTDTTNNKQTRGSLSVSIQRTPHFWK